MSDTITHLSCPLPLTKKVLFKLANKVYKELSMQVEESFRLSLYCSHTNKFLSLTKYGETK